MCVRPPDSLTDTKTRARARATHARTHTHTGVIVQASPVCAGIVSALYRVCRVLHDVDGPG